MILYFFYAGDIILYLVEKIIVVYWQLDRGFLQGKREKR